MGHIGGNSDRNQDSYRTIKENFVIISFCSLKLSFVYMRQRNTCDNVTIMLTTV